MPEMTVRPAPSDKTVVLGVGNLLLADEGVGIRAIERLQELYELPEQVQVVDGGTLGLDLLFYLEGARHLLIIDAVEMEEEAGAVVRLEGEEVPAFLSLKMSPHQVGVPDMLFAAKLTDLYPEEIVLWGVQPGLLDIGLELSPEVAARVDFLAEQAQRELTRWGRTVQRRDADSSGGQAGARRETPLCQPPH